MEGETDFQSLGSGLEKEVRPLCILYHQTLGVWVTERQASNSLSLGEAESKALESNCFQA